MPEKIEAWKKNTDVNDQSESAAMALQQIHYRWQVWSIRLWRIVALGYCESQKEATPSANCGTNQFFSRRNLVAEIAPTRTEK